jgi:N-methylhydantoinase A
VPPSRRGYRVGIDIGGTFTDFALLDPRGRVRFGKVLTTPDDPLRGLLDGLRAILADAKVSPKRLAHLLHGTTLITNAVIERKGARTALLTTAGFEDVLKPRGPSVNASSALPSARFCPTSSRRSSSRRPSTSPS